MRRVLWPIIISIAMSTAAAAQSPSGLLKHHNNFRSQYRISKLVADPTLNRYAQAHAMSMARNNQMIHSDDDKLKKFLTLYAGVAENVAAGQRSEVQVMHGWWNSPGHQANILNYKFKYAGFGIARSASGRLYWCAVFAGQRWRTPPTMPSKTQHQYQNPYKTSCTRCHHHRNTR